MTDSQAEWHRNFAAATFNRSWDLLEQADRDEAADDELLAVAFASRWHWGQVGGTEQRAIGDHQIAKAASAVGLGDLSLRYARKALSVAEAEGWHGWRLVSMYEGMARACNATSDHAERDSWFARAKAELDTIEDPGDRQVIEDQLKEIPGYLG